MSAAEAHPLLDVAVMNLDLGRGVRGVTESRYVRSGESRAPVVVAEEEEEEERNIQ